MAKAAIRVLHKGLQPDRPTCVVDVGANPLEVPPYQPLLDAGICRLIGFEPQEEALAELLATRPANETYLPHAVGNGQPVTLHLTKASGFTSVFRPDPAAVRLLGFPGARVLREVQMDTVALDDLPQVQGMDLLKIDVQGGEFAVFQGARRTMEHAMAVIVELRYHPLYLGEPMMGGCDTELRAQGFRLHKFLPPTARPLPHSQAARLKKQLTRDQLVDGDAVYLRDLTNLSRYSLAQLQHLCLTAAGVFGSHSLVLHVLDHLVARGAAPSDLPERYVDALPKALRQDQGETPDKA